MELGETPFYFENGSVYPMMLFVQRCHDILAIEDILPEKYIL